jgi:hypothetical protein
MSNDKKTALYEHGDSADELDEYGIWITHKTQDEVPTPPEDKPESEETPVFSWNVLDDEPMPETDELSEAEEQEALFASPEENDSVVAPPDFEAGAFSNDDEDSTMKEPQTAEALPLTESAEPEPLTEEQSAEEDGAGEDSDAASARDETEEQAHEDSGSVTDEPVQQSALEDEPDFVSETPPDFEAGALSGDDEDSTMKEPQTAEALPLAEPTEPEPLTEEQSAEEDSAGEDSDAASARDETEEQAHEDSGSVTDEPVQQSAAQEQEIPEIPQGLDNAGKVPELLEAIIQELRLVREELTVLRHELAANKNTEQVSAETPAPAEVPAKTDGFFDEEDDEKIALTGDELENILKTSDFTEETGSDAAEEAGELEDDDKDFPLLTEEEDAAPDYLASDNDVDTLVSEEIDLIQEQDMAYLEEDPFADDASLLDEQAETLEPDNNERVHEFFDLDDIINVSITEAKNETEELELETLAEKAETFEEEVLLPEDAAAALNNDMIDDALPKDDSAGDKGAHDKSVEPDSEAQPEEDVISEAAPAASTGEADNFVIPPSIKDELSVVLCYMDQLLEALPDEKIAEFARSEYFDTYKKLFKELGLG